MAVTGRFYTSMQSRCTEYNFQKASGPESPLLLDRHCAASHHHINHPTIGRLNILSAHPKLDLLDFIR